MKNGTVCLGMLLWFCCAVVSCSDSDQTTDGGSDTSTDQQTTGDTGASDVTDSTAVTDATDVTDTTGPVDSSDGPDGVDLPDEGDTVDAGEIAEELGEDIDGSLDPVDEELGDTGGTSGLVVNSLEDLAEPPDGVVTLRAALAEAPPGQAITFDPSLDGGVIELTIVGEEHTTLKGEVMGMKLEESGWVSFLVGYLDRDYGRSALYATKDVYIDASELPSGIRIAWMGGRDDPARVLAVLGDLTMRNVTITGGYSITEELLDALPEEQPWTLGRGGGIAVWGVARLVDCTFYDNHCEGDIQAARDRGAFGGGIYANIVEMKNCVVSGNTVLGGGASGGGVFSVGGAESIAVASTIDRSSITGNRISAPNAYGGGVFSDGGGIGNSKFLVLMDSTIARNVVEPSPGSSAQALARGYWRGGGVYMSNGYLHVQGCTIVENEVYGVGRTGALGKPNLAGGVAATIGNAHAVEKMVIGHSIIAGNIVHDLSEPTSTYEHDIFTGSLLHFESIGYNRFGVTDFSQILVPVGEPGWESLIRKHYPKVGDEDGVVLADVVDLDTGVTYSDIILSVGVDATNPAVLYYEPQGGAVDQIPASYYQVERVYGEYFLSGDGPDDFLAIVLSRIEHPDHYGLTDFATNFTADFEAFLQSVDSDSGTDGIQPYTDPWNNPILTLANTQWFGPAETWNKELSNYPYIEFWHRLDEALSADGSTGMGPELLGEQAWSDLFDTGSLSENPYIFLTMHGRRVTVKLSSADQLSTPRPGGDLGDIGAVELP